MAEQVADANDKVDDEDSSSSTQLQLPSRILYFISPFFFKCMFRTCPVRCIHDLSNSTIKFEWGKIHQDNSPQEQISVSTMRLEGGVNNFEIVQLPRGTVGPKNPSINNPAGGPLFRRVCRFQILNSDMIIMMILFFIRAHACSGLASSSPS